MNRGRAALSRNESFSFVRLQLKQRGAIFLRPVLLERALEGQLRGAMAGDEVAEFVLRQRGEAPDPEPIIQSAVDVFLRAYRPKDPA